MKSTFTKSIGMMMALMAFVLLQQSTLAQCNAGEVEVSMDISTDNWGYECYWEIVPGNDNCGVGTIASGGNSAQVGCNGGGGQDATTAQGYGDNTTINEGDWCLVLGETYTLHYVDDWGDGGAQFAINMGGFPLYNFMGTGTGDEWTFVAMLPPPYDVADGVIGTFGYVSPGEVMIHGHFMNHGSEVITEVEVNYQVDGGFIETATVSSLNVDPFTELNIAHPTMWMAENGEHDVEMWVSLINGNVDANTDDDVAAKMITVGPPIPNILDDYIGFIPDVEELAGSGEGVQKPNDLDFHPILSRNELWVVLKSTEASGGKTVKITDAGEPGQDELVQQDGNAWHFMSLPTALAFSENENFATSPGVYDANHDGGQPFTGPALWSSDPDIYAQDSGGNGSHLDMLHESPYSMGIAWEVDNKFWVTCGDHDEIMSYDFGEDHGPGNDDHSDGIIYKYEIPDWNEDPQHNVPSHLALDHATNWLYFTGTENDKVYRLDITSGTPGNDATPHESVEVYKYMDDFTYEEYVTSGLTEPSGIDIVGNRMIVGNFDTGDIMLYDISGNSPLLLTTIPTGAAGLTGLKVGPDGKIWYTNQTTNKVMRVTFTSISVEELESTLQFDLYPNPSTSGSFTVSIPQDVTSVDIDIYNELGQKVWNEQHVSGKQKFETGLAAGVYNVRLREHDGSKTATQTLVIVN